MIRQFAFLLVLATVPAIANQDRVEEAIIQAESAACARPIFFTEELEKSRRQCAHLLAELIGERPDDGRLQRTGRKFAHDMLRSYPEETGEFVALRRAVIAARLDVSVDYLLSEPGFERFVVANHLDARIAHFDHAVDIDESGEPHLLVGGTFEPFHTLRERLAVDDRGKMTKHQYLFNGIVKGRPDSCVRPFDIVEAPGHHLLEIVRCKSGKPHSWLRLTKPGGRLFSLGFYGPRPIIRPMDVAAAMIPCQGRLMSPDPAEFMVDAEDVDVLLARAVDADCFNSILKLARELQGSEEIVYQVLGLFGGDNCHTFADRLMKLASEQGEE